METLWVFSLGAPEGWKAEGFNTEDKVMRKSFMKTFRADLAVYFACCFSVKLALQFSLSLFLILYINLSYPTCSVQI